MSRFYVVALTGQSGTGKSYASSYIAKNGIPIIDGDVVAREVVERGSECLLRLVEEFSAEILNPDETLNRKKLAEICFSDPQKKITLDNITHPFIINEILKRFEALKQQGYRYCVVEAAALIESGLYANCDKIVLITADKEKKIERIMKRDNITYDHANARISAQLDESVVQKLSDIVLENNGTRHEFDQKLDALIQEIDKWFE